MPAGELPSVPTGGAEGTDGGSPGRTDSCLPGASSGPRRPHSAGSRPPTARRGLPYLVLFQIALPLLAPLIDVFALYGILFLDPVPVVGYWLGFNLLMLAQGAYAFHLDRERPRVLWAMPLQTFVYRQLMYLVVLQSVASALQGLRLRWQHVERSGDIEVATESPR